MLILGTAIGRTYGTGSVAATPPDNYTEPFTLPTTDYKLAVTNLKGRPVQNFQIIRAVTSDMASAGGTPTTGMRVSNDGGATYESTGYKSTAWVSGNSVQTLTDRMYNQGADGSDKQFDTLIIGLGVADFPTMSVTRTLYSSTGSRWHGCSQYQTAEVNDAIRFGNDTQNFSGGSIRWEGYEFTAKDVKTEVIDCAANPQTSYQINAQNGTVIFVAFNNVTKASGGTYNYVRVGKNSILSTAIYNRGDYSISDDNTDEDATEFRFGLNTAAVTGLLQLWNMNTAAPVTFSALMHPLATNGRISAGWCNSTQTMKKFVIGTDAGAFNGGTIHILKINFKNSVQTFSGTPAAANATLATGIIEPGISNLVFTGVSLSTGGSLGWLGSINNGASWDAENFYRSGLHAQGTFSQAANAVRGNLLGSAASAFTGWATLWGLGNPLSVPTSEGFAMTTAAGDDAEYSWANRRAVRDFDAVRIETYSGTITSFAGYHVRYGAPLAIPIDAAFLDDQTKLLINFEGTNGQTSATDLTGNAGTITFSGNAAITTSQAMNGSFTSSLNLDGTNDHIIIPNVSFFDPQGDPWTIEIKARNTDAMGSLDPARHLWAMATEGGGNQYHELRFSPNGVSSNPQVIYTDRRSGAYTDRILNRALSGVYQNVWHDYAITFDGSILTLYVDGVVIAQNTPTVKTLESTPGVMDLRIGGRQGETNEWKGQVQAIRFTLADRFGGQNYTPEAKWTL